MTGSRPETAGLSRSTVTDPNGAAAGGQGWFSLEGDLSLCGASTWLHSGFHTLGQTTVREALREFAEEASLCLLIRHQEHFRVCRHGTAGHFQNKHWCFWCLSPLGCKQKWEEHSFSQCSPRIKSLTLELIFNIFFCLPKSYTVALTI